MLLVVSGIEGRCCTSSFRPFENLNTRSTSWLLSTKLNRTAAMLVKAELFITVLRNNTGVPNGVSTVISATYAVAFRDSVMLAGSDGQKRANQEETSNKLTTHLVNN